MSSDPLPDPGLLIVLSGPSGAGKSTLVRAARDVFRSLEYSISYTTRAPRGAEVDGRDYFFVTPDAFSLMLAHEEFAEWAKVHGNHYGTSKAFVEERLRAGRYVLLDIDVQGAAKIKAWRPDALFIFCAPPSQKVLEQRLRGRATDAEAVIARRLRDAREEVRQAVWYDYVIINDDLETAIASFTAILKAEGCRRERTPQTVSALLAAYGLDHSSPQVDGESAAHP